MKYVEPIGAEDPNASYVNANPGADIEGSPVPAEAIEHPMREIEAVIKAGGLIPSNGDLTQLVQAIQGMVGGFGRRFGFDTNRIITVDQINSHINIFGTCTAITLPRVAEIPPGSVLFFCGCSLACKISAAAGDSIFGNNANPGLQSLTIENGGWLMFISSKNAWFVSGTSALKFSDNFASLLSTDGYQKYPGGKIEQWGRAVTNAQGVATFNYPTPMLVGTLRAFVSVEVGENPAFCTVGGTSLTSATAYAISPAGVPIASKPVIFLTIGK